MVAFKCKVKIRKLAHEQYKRQAMKVILINPNSTEAMTLSSVETAQKTAPEINFEDGLHLMARLLFREKKTVTMLLNLC